LPTLLLILGGHMRGKRWPADPHGGFIRRNRLYVSAFELGDQ
jgi:hypothetical protein